MKLTKTILIVLTLLFAASAVATPTTTMNDLPDSATLQDGIDIEGSSSGEDLDEISIRVRDPGDTFWNHIETKDCEGLPDCSISLQDWSPDNTGTKSISVFAEDNNGEGDPSDYQEVDFTDDSQDAQLEVSLSNLDDEAPTGEEFNIDASASGENLDSLTIEYREENGDWTDLETKNCEGLPDCSIDSATYNTDTEQEVDFKAIIEEESGDTNETDLQSVEFTSSDSIDSKSMNDLPDEAFTGENVDIEGSASGENLDSLEILIDDGDGFSVWEEKNCNNALDCSMDETYSTEDAGDVSFKLRVTAGDNEENTSAQEITFVEPELSISPESPINSGEVEFPVDFSWSTYNPENIDIDYTLTVEDENGDEVFSEDNIGDTDYSMDEELDDGDYTWNVDAIDGDGDERADADGSFELNDRYVDSASMNDLPDQQLLDEDMEIEASSSGKNLESLVIKERVSSGWETYEEKDCQEALDCSIDITDYSRDDEEEVDFKAIATAGTGSNEEEIETDTQSVEFVEETYLEADFDYSPESPEEGETVEFEPDSTGDIEEWDWDFGDGETASGETVEHSFDDDGEYPVELTVSDGEETDDETKIVYVGHDASSCDIEVGEVEFDPQNVQPGEDSTVSITVENDGDEQDIEVSFEINDYLEETEEDTLQSGEEKTYSYTVNKETDTDVGVTVETDSGGDNPCGSLSWSRFDTLNVVEEGETDANFNFDVEDEDGDALEDVMIEGENGNDFTRYTDEDGEASADVESGEYEITASLPGYESETETRTIDSGETRDVDFTLEEDEDAADEGQLSVLAEDLDEERLEDVEITAENGDDETGYTDEDGRLFMSLEEGDYTVKAEKDGYLDQARDIEIEDGERTPVLFEMVDEDEDSIRITDLEFNETICAGETLSVTVSIRNSRDSDELVTMRTEGLGTETEREVVTDRGETITREVRLTNVEGSGTEEFTVSIDNSVYDEETGEVEVEDCGTTDQPDDEATGLTAEVNPRTIQAGDTVNVRGFVDGIRGATEVEIESNGDTIARTNTDRSGYYSTYVRFETPDSKNLDINAGGLTRTRNVEVLATANVGGITAPRQVFESEEFEICADVGSQVEADVVLLRNGQVVESKSGVGEVCFETEAGEAGAAIYEVRALTSGQGGSATRAVEVLEQGDEVESFPGQLASVESGGSIARVELYNTNDDLESYSVDLTGIDERWFAQSDETVQLRSGERETVYIYLTPRAEGEYRPVLSVSSEGTTIYSEYIILETEGTTDSNPPGFFERLLRALGL